MNIWQKQALKELEELQISHAETGRDREYDYPNTEEEELITWLESVAAGDKESIKEYIFSKLHVKCRTCCALDLVCAGQPPETTKQLDCYVPGPTKE